MTLVCAGTEGEVSFEDLLGCGAVVGELQKLTEIRFASDAAEIAHRLFAAARADLAAVLRNTRGGRNIIAAGLSGDIDFCARLNVLDIAARCDGERMIVRSLASRV